MRVALTTYDQKPAIKFPCPGCGSTHVITVNGNQNNKGATWEWDGKFDFPTISPSIKATCDYEDHSLLSEADYGPWTPCPGVPGASGREVLPASLHKLKKIHHCCHSFVRAGRIEFLPDCTHALAGKTVDLREIVDEEVD